MNNKLLTRDAFREGVFARDNHKCVICGAPAQDAHHILERRLWGDGGYYLDNGASLCGECHLKAEETTISVEKIREACKILKPIYPDHLYDEYNYDKWGNIEMPNGTRIIGELFYDESVQKILKQGGVLDLFVPYVKYQRTYHLPNSPTVNKDDRQLTDTSNFDGKEVVVTIKMDGENSSMYRDYYHARSLDSKNHPSRNWAKVLHSNVCYDIPEGWRICGENLYAKHSIKYTELDSYFYVFSIWNDKNVCLSWEDTCQWCDLIGNGLDMVPVLYEGVFDAKLIQDKFDEYVKNSVDEVEGYVVRLADSFSYGEFKKSIAKWVRPHHVQTHGHWMRAKLEPNGLYNDG